MGEGGGENSVMTIILPAAVLMSITQSTQFPIRLGKKHLCRKELSVLR